MSQWTNVDEANGAPKYVVDATTGRTGIQEYGNTVFGVETDSAVDGASSPGWVRVVEGSGRVTGITVTAGGSGYSANDDITVGEDSGKVLTVSNTGAILTVNVAFSGDLVSELPEVEVDSEGTGATFALTYEGRIGRKQIETLVAMRGMQD